LVRALLASSGGSGAAAPFYEGMRLLGARTPDLTLIALRLVLSGRRADDDAVVAVRAAAERARAGDAAARDEYAALLRPESEPSR